MLSCLASSTVSRAQFVVPHACFVFLPVVILGLSSLKEQVLCEILADVIFIRIII